MPAVLLDPAEMGPMAHRVTAMVETVVTRAPRAIVASAALVVLPEQAVMVEQQGHQEPKARHLVSVVTAEPAAMAWRRPSTPHRSRAPVETAETAESAVRAEAAVPVVTAAMATAWVATAAWAATGAIQAVTEVTADR